MTSQERPDLNASTVAGTRTGPRPTLEAVPALTVVAHPDLERVGARVLLPALVSGREVELSRLSPSFAHPGATGPPLPLADLHLSRRPLRLRPEPAGIRLLRGEHGGDCEVAGEPLGEELLVPRSGLESGVVILLAHRVALLLHSALPGAGREPRRFGLLGESDAVERLREEIGRVAALEVPVLLRGETGTGKELVARALHDAGPRRQGPWVAVNLAAVPPSLAAAELFGAARGAFTGADRPRQGHFRRAHGGTLFLDEIGSAPVELQDLLLRALEEKIVQPVGAEAPVAVDVRLIAATDVNLAAAMERGSFRAPFFHRLSGWEIRLPPLAERRDDVARLLVAFLRRELEALDAGGRLADPGPRGRPWLPAPLVARLVTGRWPGNVRHLLNVARRLAISSLDRQEAALDAELERELAAGAASPAPEPEAPPPRTVPRKSYRPPAEVSEAELLAALRAHRWRLQPTAQTLGVSRTSLYSLIDQCSAIRKAADLDRREIRACLERTGGDLDAAVEILEVSRHGLLLRLKELGLSATGGGRPEAHRGKSEADP